MYIYFEVKKSKQYPKVQKKKIKRLIRVILTNIEFHGIAPQCQTIQAIITKRMISLGKITQNEIPQSDITEGKTEKLSLEKICKSHILEIKLPKTRFPRNATNLKKGGKLSHKVPRFLRNANKVNK